MSLEGGEAGDSQVWGQEQLVDWVWTEKGPLGGTAAETRSQTGIPKREFWFRGILCIFLLGMVLELEHGGLSPPPSLPQDTRHPRGILMCAPPASEGGGGWGSQN